MSTHIAISTDGSRSAESQWNEMESELEWDLSYLVFEGRFEHIVDHFLVEDGRQ